MTDWGRDFRARRDLLSHTTTLLSPPSTTPMVSPRQRAPLDQVHARGSLSDHRVCGILVRTSGGEKASSTDKAF